jgi:1-aminocyclopropane-1-carboxylate deaminase
MHDRLGRQVPRVRLALLPTPVHLLQRLSEHVGGPQVWIKRDDLTGLGAGGNKVRKLEWLLGDALEQGADTLVTIGAVQSNHTRQTVAAAVRGGLRCTLLQERWVDAPGAADDRVGNILLSRLMGADVRVMEGAFRPGAGEEPNARLDAVADELRQAGRVPYVIPRGASDHPLGALGYASCAREIAEQARELDGGFGCVVHATSSGSTQAGLVAGFVALDSDIHVIGIEVNADAAMTRRIVRRLAADTAHRLDGDVAAARAAVDVREGFAGPAYGVPARETVQAIRLVAELEGIVLDPVYEGKAMAGLIALIRAGALREHRRVLFMHLGGDPAIHAYGDVLLGEHSLEH